MRTVVLLAIILCFPLVHAATYTLSSGQNYTVEGNTFTVFPASENGTVLQRPDNTSFIVTLKDCLRYNYTETCLSSATATTSTFTEEYTGPTVTATHTVGASTADLGDEVEGTITIKNTGDQVARGVQVSIELPAGLEFTNGNEQFEWVGDVRDTITTTYTFLSLVNGSYNITGMITHPNGSGTVTEDLTLRTHTVTLPFTLSFGFEPNATRGNLSIVAKKKATENFSFDFTLVMPPEMNVTSVTKNLRVRDHTIEYHSRENDSTVELNVLYHLLGPPSRHLEFTLEYDRDEEDEQLIGANYSFTTIEESDPSIAVSVDQLTENSSGTIRVTITGNRSGKLWLRGLLDYTVDAAGGSYNFTVPGREAGNYTLDVQFISTDRYGEEHVAAGAITVPVAAAQPAQPQPESPAPSPAANESVAEPVVAPETDSFPFKLLVAALGCLVLVLGFLVHHFRDPLSRIEKLTDEVVRLRTELTHRTTPPTPEELIRLATLEEKLGEMQNELEETG